MLDRICKTRVQHMLTLATQSQHSGQTLVVISLLIDWSMPIRILTSIGTGPWMSARALDGLRRFCEMVVAVLPDPWAAIIELRICHSEPPRS